MQFKRQEGFRYAFTPPIKGTFQLVKQNDKLLTIKPGAADILDLSPNGLRFSAGLDIPVNEANWETVATFTLNEVPLSLTGTIVWKKRSAAGFHYGMECENNDQTQERIVLEMKQYIKSS